ncbi:hypothetical protein NUM_68140 [Actinocatenispora comari]|uniref:Uncharacterized protein n=1 Tax=Actinocatenispora comari TaxID=2807577 RepID=A0A8J4AJ62_9ACTN|nr:hypothetical protein NUM_68140 [Actinocatenispora comari]
MRSEAAGSRGITRAILGPATKRAGVACRRRTVRPGDRRSPPSGYRYDGGDAGGPAANGEPTAASPQMSTMDGQDRNGT